MTKVVLECDRIIRWVLGLVLRLLPLFIFLAVLTLLTTINVEQLVPFAYAFLAAVGAMLVFDILYVVIACIRTGKSIGTILHACAPGALIALTTTSSAAAYWICAKHMEDDLGLEHNTVDFSLPLGIPLYQPEMAQYLLCMIAFVTVYEGGMPTLSTLIIGIVFCTLLGIATPPIPGGALMVYTALFTQMGFGLEPLALIMAVDFISDALTTGSKMFALPLQILLARHELQGDAGSRNEDSALQ